METAVTGLKAGDIPRDHGPVRFGVLFDGLVLQEWQARCLRALLAEDARLELLIVAGPGRPEQGQEQAGPDRAKRWPRQEDFLFTVFRKLLVNPRATRPVDAAEFFATVPVVSLHEASERSDGSSAAARRIAEHKLDFILDFGAAPVPEALLDSARHGVWAFHHGDGETYRDGPPGFWEIHDGERVTGAVLRRLSSRPDGSAVLARGFFPTADYSYARNVDAVSFGSAIWPARVCADIRRGVVPDLPAPPVETASPVRDRPGNRETLRLVQKLTGNVARRAVNRLTRRPEWNIGIIQEPVDSFLQPGHRPTVDWLPAITHGFIADPFGIETDGRIHLFFEEYDSDLEKGVISHVELAGGSVVSPCRRVLDLPVHLSYPYVFEYDGTIYCLPETSGLREIALYQAVNFPLEWRKAAVLIDDLAATDATVFEFDGRWWLLCTDVDAGENLNLFIWHAPELFGPWQPHVANPVKTDIRSARPAGRPFTHDGTLYRPAQDCSRTYGGGITLNRVTRLTPEEFAEEAVVSLQPDATGDYPEGIHTLSSVGNVTFVDGKRLVFRRVLPDSLRTHLSRAREMIRHR